MAAVSPKYTVGKIRNSSKETMSLLGRKIWQGSQTADFPDIIDNEDVGEFSHNAYAGEDETLGSVVALAYKRADGIKWIVAWSNHVGVVDNKVYTAILKQSAAIHWEQIKTDLEARGRPKFSTTMFGYTSEIEIDPQYRFPTMKAKIEPSVV